MTTLGTTGSPPLPRSSRPRHLAAGALLCLGVAVAALAGVSWTAITTHVLGIVAGAVLLYALLRRSLQPQAVPAAPDSENIALLERVNEAAQAAGVRVFDWDLVNNRLALDPRRLHLYSAEARELADAPAEFMKRVVHPDDLESFDRDITDALKHKTQVTLSYRVVRGDGTVHPVQLHGRVFRGPNGRATRLLGITADRTAQVAAADKIAQQAREMKLALERLDIATEFAGVGIWDWDLVSGRLTADANKVKLFQRNDGDDIVDPQQFIKSIIHPDDYPEFQRVIRDAVARATSLEHSYRTVHPDGSVHHVQLHAKIFRDEQQRALRFLAVTVETTRLVEAAAKLERQAKEQQELVSRFSLAANAAGISVWEWDIATNRILTDARMTNADIYGQIGDRVDANHFLNEGLHPDDRVKFIETMLGALASGSDIAHRYRVLTPQGRAAYMQLHGRVVRDADGKASRVLGVSWDVTAQAEAAARIEQQTREQQLTLERLDLATEAAGIGIWDWDLTTGKLTADNQVAKSFHQQDGASLCDANEFSQKYIHPEDLPRYEASMREALAHDDSVECSYRIVLPNGGLRHTQLHGRIFRDAAGKPTRLLGVTLDTTRLVEAATKLERQAEHEHDLLRSLNLATKAAGIGVWDWDVRTDRLTSDAFIAQAYGLDALDIKEGGRDFFTRAVHPQDRAGFDAALDAALAGSDSFSHRYRVLLPGEHLRHVQIHSHIDRDAEGGALRLHGVTMDVTAEMHHTEQLQQQAEQERALRDRLNLATRTAGIGVWDMDMDTHVVTADANLDTLLGLHGDFQIEMLRQVVHPEDADKVWPPVYSAMRDPQHDGLVSLRHRVIRFDGVVRHVQTHVRLFRDETARVRRMLGVTWDVTAEVEHAEQLSNHAAHVQKLVDRMSVANQAAGISPWEMDLRTRKFVWAENRSKALDLANISVEELNKHVHPDDMRDIEAATTAAIDSGQETFSYRFRLQHPGGTTRHMQSYVHVIRDERGKAVGMLGATTDITNEVQTNELLQRQAEQERALTDRLTIATEAAGICSWEIDLTKREFLWVENPILGLLNINEDFKSLDLLVECLHPEDRMLFNDALREARKSGSNRISYRYRARTRDGRNISVQSHARLLPDETGQLKRVLGVSWDVTGEVLAAEKLEQQARHERMLLDRLSMATEAAGISSWEVDLVEQRFVMTEHSMRMLHGMNDFKGSFEEFFALVHEDDREVFTNAVRDALRAKRNSFSYRYRVPTPQGGIVYIQTHARLLFDETGRARRLLGISWDATEEIEAAEQLRDAERRLERASLSSFEGHWEADLTTRRMWMSSSYYALLGYEEGEFGDDIDSVQNLIHPEDLPGSRQTVRDNLTSAKPFHFDSRIRTKRGEYRWFRQRGMAERGADGKALRVSGSIQDIHEQKLAEHALQQAQSRFARAINGTQDGLWELESDGTAWCSPRIAELLGYATEEFSSDTNFLRLFLHPDDAAAVSAATQAHFEEELPYDVEIRLRSKGGEYRWYRARATAERDVVGRPQRLSGSLQDVTEARAAREELLRATEAAEAANRAKSEFLANVSHEIRTPMNGIIGMSGLLLDTALDRTQRDYAETIRTSADSLLIVINDILDFSKIEAGKLDIEAIDLDLRGNVEDVGTMMAFQAAAKNLELVIHVHPDVPDRVVGDPQRVRQCLVNLVGNAIKFTSRGEIVIEVSNVGRRDGRVLTQFEVRDTGIGIAPEVLRTLFQPFVQADSSTTRHFGGTGLGLSIVRRLVDMMGGQVGVHSEVNQGSTFWFTLPLEPVAPATAQPPIDLTRLGRRILVVDDNETNRRVLADQLKRVGYEVSLAAGGEEALSLLRQAMADNLPVEAVLADYHMGDMDGATLGEKINSDPSLARSRIVMLTSMDRHGDIYRFASLGFAAYLTKPVRARELLDCLDRVLARDAKEWHLRSQPIVTRGTLVSNDPTRRYNASVLLVEDNAVNQKVAVRFLDRMGCKVRVADNGAEGVRAFAEARYDIVLMDLQMPVMDGLTATRRIREIEGSARPTPIVALTANAMAGQLERCMEAGMNGFLTKPLEIARLHETFDRYGLGVTPAETDAAAAPSPATPVNLARLNEITDGDPEFAYELAATFITSGEQVLQEIRVALASFDRVALGRAAHKLKGASANIHADPLRDLAYALESQAANLDQPRLKELIEQLEECFGDAAMFLREQAPPPAAKAG